MNIGTNSSKSAIIGDYAIINSHVCCIVEPVNIGTDAVIVAGSVLPKILSFCDCRGVLQTKKKKIMKIVELITFLAGGGAERFVVDLSNQLAKENEKHILLLFWMIRRKRKLEFF